ncbi:MAG: amidohydrolase family protein [Holophagales bacterium]|nr:amidohydrolase family protein [Holophagales bacterium]
MIIDAWAQHPTRRQLADPILESLRRWTRGLGVGLEEEAAEMPVSWTLASMAQAGVSRGLISAWVAPGRVMISNDEVAGFVDQSDGRLIGVGSVDISDPMAAVREIRRCVRELGFKAIRVLPWLWELPPTHARFYPVYVECCELGVPFCTQVGHTGPLMPSEYGRPIPYIDQVALDFPDLVIVGGHIGYPWTEEMVAVATKHPNVYIDTSAYTADRYPEALVRYLRHHGRTKVLFGSNWPMIPPAKALAGLPKLELDDETRELFLAGNAIRVFGLDDA